MTKTKKTTTTKTTSAMQFGVNWYLYTYIAKATIAVDLNDRNILSHLLVFVYKSHQSMEPSFSFSHSLVSKR